MEKDDGTNEGKKRRNIRVFPSVYEGGERVAWSLSGRHLY